MESDLCDKLLNCCNLYLQGQFKSTVQCMTCRKTSITFDAFMYLSVPLKSSGKCSLQVVYQCWLRFSD